MKQKHYEALDGVSMKYDTLTIDYKCSICNKICKILQFIFLAFKLLYRFLYYYLMKNWILIDI